MGGDLSKISKQAQDFLGKPEEKKDDDEELPWPTIIGGTLGVIGFLYLFLIGLGLMGDAFKCLGGRGAGNMFTGVDNPIAGLMVGILATVMVQSSSTSTSIVVGLVGADQITVRTGIPIIMGANIGTSVTNTIVSMGQVGNRLDLERAFAGATVHDMFNMLSVATLLPIEVIIAAMSGEGGIIYWITKGFTEALVGGDKGGELFDSPIKVVTKPVTKAIISNNKYVIYALGIEKPLPKGAEEDFNTTLCEETSSGRRLEAEEQAQGERALLSRRLTAAGETVCGEYKYYCVNSALDKNFKKISKKAYKKLTKCSDFVTKEDPCGADSSDKCYLDAGAYYDKYVTNGHIVKGGMLDGAGDSGAGIIALILSLLFLIGGLFGLVKSLQLLLVKKAKKMVAKATQLNDYLAILVGVGVTIIVQSSSVVTSALTPLCGMGVLPLEKMLPLTLGANIGTTCTALIAALATMKFDALHIALCHLFFNLIGICIWFPVPFMRQVPLNAARLLGLYASFYRFVPGLYILIVFVIVPGVLLGISGLMGVSAVGGVFVLLLVLAGAGAAVYWWIWMGGCYKVLSQEDRENRLVELEKSNSTMRGEDDDDEAPAKVMQVVPFDGGA